ncbi:MAG: type II toxin-antitoxin system RelE/ParE family toxin [Proteobacteria bacterium]|nr:type II toxin-antitoxin system RelE/ParE family toxin [Pseudomonadota bacterium]
MRESDKLITIVETITFSRKCKKVLSESELDDLKIYLAATPEAGDVIPGLRGIRKFRWQASQKGKSGGARVIYFFYTEKIPIFLLDIYKKSNKSDLSDSEKKVLNSLINELIESYGG